MRESDWSLCVGTRPERAQSSSSLNLVRTHSKATIYVSGSFCERISHFLWLQFMCYTQRRQSPCSKFISNVTSLVHYTAGYRRTIWGLKRGSTLGSGTGKCRKSTYSECLHSKTKRSSCPDGTMLTHKLSITAESETCESSHVLISLLDKDNTQWLKQGNTTSLLYIKDFLSQNEKYKCNG